MTIETFLILNNTSPSVLAELVRVRECSFYNFIYQNILQVPQVRTTKYGKKNKISGLRQRFCGTGVQIILDKKAVLINLKF